MHLAQWNGPSEAQSRELLVCSYVCASHCAQLASCSSVARQRIDNHDARALLFTSGVISRVFKVNDTANYGFADN